MFNKIDVENWPRREVFYYFSKMAPTGYSLTIELDVTEVLAAVKERNMKFFPAYLWLVTRNLNKFSEFKCAFKEDALGYYDTLTPMYAMWHDDTKTFSFAWTEYKEDFKEFHKGYLYTQAKYGANHGFLAKPGLPPENAYTVSSVPWVEFKHFAVHSYDNKPYFFPSLEAGKFHHEGERVIMPLSITCHHATTDGWHVSQFIGELKNDIAHFGELISC